MKKHYIVVEVKPSEAGVARLCVQVKFGELHYSEVARGNLAELLQIAQELNKR